LERLHFGAGDTTTFAPWTEDSAPLQVAEFKPGERHEGVQHRHLDYQLAYARQAGRRWDRIDLRLVEHLGRAGLLIFHDGAGPAPLLAWSVCGEENGRPFMLLLPSDSPGRYQLDRLGRSDWRFVIAAVDWLASTLAREADRSDRWLGVARRLRRELAELPPRLRYDGVRVDLPQPGSDGAVTVVLTGSMFGARNFGELTLLWRAGGPLASSSELELQAPSECCDRPLSSWPTNASGDPASSVVLPVGACSAAARRRAWSVFAPIDGTLVLGLLDALPAMAARVASRSAEVSAMAQNGAAYISVPLANTLRNEGHALARSMRWRRLLARAVARLYGAREVDQ
jgi:hypothetical protein